MLSMSVDIILGSELLLVDSPSPVVPLQSTTVRAIRASLAIFAQKICAN
jgi:hypothetical protein